MFHIIEQGVRITTPIDSLFKREGVEKVTGVSRIAAVSASSAEQKRIPSSHSDSYQQVNRQEHERNRVIYAEQIMSSPVTVASEKLSVGEIWTLFSQQPFHHLPILDDNSKLQGIVSDRDILRFSANRDRNIASTQIKQLMSKQVLSAGKNTEVREIAELMCARKIGALPIVDDDSPGSVSVIGIVTRSDILRTLVHRAPLELWA